MLFVLYVKIYKEMGRDMMSNVFGKLGNLNVMFEIDECIDFCIVVVV